MKSLFIRTLLGCGVAAAVVGAAPSEAHAWLKFKNSTNTTINVAHAFDSRSTDFCGWYDSCPVTTGVNRYRVKYWWVLAPGAESTVNANDFENALNEFYAFAVDGTVWEGGGQTFRISMTERGEHCGWSGTKTSPTADKVFRRLNTSRCCGIIDCAGGDPADRRVQLVK